MNSEKILNRYWVIVAAAGSGQRMQADCPKQYLTIHHKTIFEHTLAIFDQADWVDAVVVVLADADPYWPAVKKNLTDYSVPLYEVAGGKERCDSVFNAMKSLQQYASPEDWVLVHDAARPCVSQQDISKLKSVLQDEAIGGLLAASVKDTIKQSDASGRVSHTVDRTNLWRALTPQMFRFEVLYKALQEALIDQSAAGNITDDASAIEQLGYKPLLVEGSSDNIKITTPDDMIAAEAYLLQANNEGISDYSGTD
ncbi:2-C-methyl-D-erythritol 4-phosphate cytidylyltransferase [hydrothermal vent metagenome]|uniref:2-C-methyl-D-erythritol 4-phosphate cytidylyltransferase n=1 Tax=hydrothermal vent metagenome TaxID=652676 RepID=A0A3B0YP30_9ZZZZ